MRRSWKSDKPKQKDIERRGVVHLARIGRFVRERVVQQILECRIVRPFRLHHIAREVEHVALSRNRVAIGPQLNPERIGIRQTRERGIAAGVDRALGEQDGIGLNAGKFGVVFQPHLGRKSACVVHSPASRKASTRTV